MLDVADAARVAAGIDDDDDGDGARRDPFASDEFWTADRGHHQVSAPNGRGKVCGLGVAEPDGRVVASSNMQTGLPRIELLPMTTACCPERETS